MLGDVQVDFINGDLQNRKNYPNSIIDPFTLGISNSKTINSLLTIKFIINVLGEIPTIELAILQDRRTHRWVIHFTIIHMLQSPSFLILIKLTHWTKKYFPAIGYRLCVKT